MRRNIKANVTKAAPPETKPTITLPPPLSLPGFSVVVNISDSLELASMVGELEGILLGSVLGLVVRNKEGAVNGNAFGCNECLLFGLSVGLKEAAMLGFLVGFSDGKSDGVWIACIVGVVVDSKLDGANVGNVLGFSDGISEGFILGFTLGTNEGTLEGEYVGSMDGSKDGVELG